MEPNEEEIVDLPETEEGEEDSTDYKSEYLKTKGIADRLKKKLEKQKLEEKVEKKVDEKLSEKGLDRMDKAILRLEKITSPSEIQLVEEMMKETGKDVEALMESKYFQSELKAMREAEATKVATPAGSKRSGDTARDEVDYWIAKGELPPVGQNELRQKVVARKRQAAQSSNTFSDEPVA